MHVLKYWKWKHHPILYWWSKTALQKQEFGEEIAQTVFQELEYYIYNSLIFRIMRFVIYLMPSVD